ncbi:MAG: RNA degradosome polyphosphate kinase [Bacillota bacterium]|nr:RNA degradosome polyphosphate kinase [Bacillota bacterium]
MKRTGKKSSRTKPEPVADVTSLSPYINRELSWLEFNDRVLEEARDKANPLMERLNFLAITCSNLDEFFMIRVASLKDLVNAGYDRPDPAGLNPVQQLAAISERTHRMVARQYSTCNRALLPALVREQIRIIKPEELNDEQMQFVHRYFHSTVYPILTPMAVDAARPFPLISNRSLNLCVTVDRDLRQKPEKPDFAIIQVPSVIPRLLDLPSASGRRYMLLEDVIRLHLDELFSGVHIGKAWCFRIMRNADLDIDEEDAADLLTEIEKQLKMRQWGQVIRLEVEDEMEDEQLMRLVDLLSIEQQDMYSIDGPLDLTFFNQIFNTVKQPDLFYPPHEPQPVRLNDETDIFAAIRKKDLFLHHPYDRFDPVIELVRRAANDPDVLAIKQTLYRVSGQSPVVRCLAEAAERGKQVMVLVELKARFDEENNIHWARQLEQAGCHVIYGLVGLKTHSKITLVVRRDEDGIRRYVHLGTGNYNDITARFYTDMGVMTCSESMGKDASAFFNMLSGYSAPRIWHQLTVAPYWLRHELERRIDQEISAAGRGDPARIIIKANSLVDPLMISRLYQASSAGVRIDLIIRGICCLRPGVPGLSENISVRSIIGRFLEHSRIFYFYHDGGEDLFLSSADWMPRNLDRRVELMFPIEDEDVHRRIMQVLNIQLEDTERARLMLPDGRTVRVDRRGKPHLDCQRFLCEQALADAHEAAEKNVEYRFEPADREEG